MMGARGEVVGCSDARLLVRIGSELWSAQSPDTLAVGDRVEVVAVNRLVLKVKAPDARAATTRRAPPSPSGSRIAKA